MGLLNNVQTKKSESAPWSMPGGVYLADIYKITVEKGEGSNKPIFTLQFMIDHTACAEMLKREGVTPLDLPSGAAITYALDASDETHAMAITALFGRPFVDAKLNRVTWSGGLVQWDGKTDDTARFPGKLELTIDSKPSNTRKNGGFWPAVYKVTDISAPGSANADAQLAMMGMIDPEEAPPKKK